MAIPFLIIYSDYIKKRKEGQCTILFMEPILYHIGTTIDLNINNLNSGSYKKGN